VSTVNSSHADTFLPPIEKPGGTIMKLVYAITRRQFGKVLTPLKVFSARLPLAYGLFYARNICLFCIDIARSFAIKTSMNQARFDALDQYQSSLLFSNSERALLEYVTELTRDKRVDPEIFQRLRGLYSERAICEIVWLVAIEHVYNMTNIGLNIHSDMLCDISKNRRPGK
jgi:alkylhydroperoxidase family enzyme